MLALFIKQRTTFIDHVIKENNSISLDSDQWMLLISVLLIQHICQLICNAHSINFFVDDSDDSHFYETATGLYPLISIMNHSCDPNIITR